MRFIRELTEPWGLLMAATAAGAAWAVQLPIAVAAGVGGIALLARAAFAASGRGDGPADPAETQVDPRTPEGKWVGRAQRAADNVVALAATLPPGPLADQVNGMTSTIAETVTDLRQLAGRVTTTSQALARIDAVALAGEDARLRSSRASAAPELHAELDRSLASVQSQREVHQRLSDNRNKLFAQLEAGALGLESLTARVVELSATADVPLASAGADGSAVEGLEDQLEGIRRGVAETEQATRRALGSD